MAEEIIWATSTTGEDFQCVHVRDWEIAHRRIAELEALVRDTPVLIIDVGAAKARGETEAVKYAHDLIAWRQRADKIRSNT